MTIQPIVSVNIIVFKLVRTHKIPVYEQYYASLEAASQVQSTVQTPLPESLGDTFEQQEDVKPDKAYLDSLSSSGKRSRSPDDIGTRENKALRSSTGTPIYSRSGSSTALLNALENVAPFASSLEPTESTQEADAMVVTEQPAADEPLVMGRTSFYSQFRLR